MRWCESDRSACDFSCVVCRWQAILNIYLFNIEWIAGAQQLPQR
jgi:hypothetical protein